MNARKVLLGWLGNIINKTCQRLPGSKGNGPFNLDGEHAFIILRENRINYIVMIIVQPVSVLLAIIYEDGDQGMGVFLIDLPYAFIILSEGLINRALTDPRSAIASLKKIAWIVRLERPDPARYIAHYLIKLSGYLPGLLYSKSYSKLILSALIRMTQ